jgi:hypothetical protein
MKHIALLLAVLMVASVAQAGITYTIKETVAGTDIDLQNAGLLIQTDVQDAGIDYADSTMTTPGSTPQVEGSADWVQDLGSYPPWGVYDKKIVAGVENLTTLLPVADVDLIESAYIVICRSNKWGSETVDAYQLTTQWMWGESYPEAGQSEGYLAGTHIESVLNDNGTPEVPEDDFYEDVEVDDVGGVSMAYTYDDGLGGTYGWGTGSAGFTSADYDASTKTTASLPGDGSTVQLKIDILDIVKAWYSGELNAGVVLMLSPESQGDGNPYFAPAEGTAIISASGGTLDAGNTGTKGLRFEITLVPEPATMGLLAIGGIAALIRRKRS